MGGMMGDYDDVDAMCERLWEIAEKLNSGDLSLAETATGELALFHDGSTFVTAVPDTGDRVADSDRLLRRWEYIERATLAGYDVAFVSDGHGPEYRVTSLRLKIAGTDIVAAESDVAEDVGYTETLRRLLDEIALEQLLILSYERMGEA